jgi:hypothetical protein
MRAVSYWVVAGCFCVPNSGGGLAASAEDDNGDHGAAFEVDLPSLAFPSAGFAAAGLAGAGFAAAGFTSAGFASAALPPAGFPAAGALCLPFFLAGSAASGRLARLAISPGVRVGPV